MKKSGSVGLVLIAALGLASCGSAVQSQADSKEAASKAGSMSWDDKPRDPCSPEHFQDETCKSAINNRGYHYGGFWFPMAYALGYRNYYDNHRNHLARGGAHTPPPASIYSPRATPMTNLRPPSPPAGSAQATTTQRGGFGSTARANSTAASPSRRSAGS